MVGAEPWPPDDRPPLTEKFMTGQLDDTTLAADPAALGLDLRLGETATGLDGGVLLTDRGEHAFDALVLATGSVPVGLPGDGGQRFLRTFDDARALRDALLPGTRLAVVGAGWIGAELATTALARGCQVTVVEAAASPLAVALGPEVGSGTVPWYAEAGAALRLGQPAESGAAGRLGPPGGGWLAGPGDAEGAGEQLVAVLAVGRPRDLLQGRRVIAAGGAVDPGRLADPGIPVRDAVPAST